MSSAQSEIPAGVCDFPETVLAGGGEAPPATALSTHPAAGFLRHVVVHSFANLVALVCNGALALDGGLWLLPHLHPLWRFRGRAAFWPARWRAGALGGALTVADQPGVAPQPDLPDVAARRASGSRPDHPDSLVPPRALVPSGGVDCPLRPDMERRRAGTVCPA